MFSKSTKTEFETQFKQELNGRVVLVNNNLDNPNFNARSQLEDIADKVDYLAIFPDRTKPHAFENSLDLIQANATLATPFYILGTNTLYDEQVLKLGNAVTRQFVVAVPWYSQNEASKKFSESAKSFWAGNVNWRTATAYDAAIVLRKVLQRKPVWNRAEVQQALVNPDFAVESGNGSSGEIRFATQTKWVFKKFNGSDRMNFPPTLLRVISCPNSQRFDFVRLTDGCR